MQQLMGWRGLIAFGVLTLVAACDGQNTGSISGDTEPLNPETSDNAPPSAGSAPPPPPAGSFLGQLPPEQTSQLASLAVEVVAPGAVPPSFSVVDIRTEQPVAEEGGPDAGTSYLIVYQDPANRCFAVEFASEGFMPPPPTESRLPIQPPLFDEGDYGLNYGPFTEEDMRSQFPDDNFFTDWLVGPAGAYRLVGASYIGSLFPALASCEDISPEAAVNLVESFTVLTPEEYGDGLL